MAHIFKPTSVKPIPRNAVIKTVKGRRVATWTNRKNKAVTAELTEDGKKCRVTSPTWWIEYTAASGERDRAKGFTDRAATLQLAASLERTAEDVRSGRESPRNASPEHLADHLPAFREHLEAKGNGSPHVASVIHNVRLVITECGLTTPGTVNCDRVANWLAAERKRQSWSVENQNRYTKFLRQFGRWLVTSKRSRVNPFDQLAGATTNGERTRVRRRLPDADMLRLIDAARADPDTYHGMIGPDRARLYLLAAYTGLRISSLARLTPEAFVWSGSLPVAVSASARIVKNRKAHTVSLHPDVARAIGPWLRTRSAGKPVFAPGYWSERGAEIVAHDIEAARRKWIGEAKTKKEQASRESSDTLRAENAAGEVFDFHALRVQFISNLAIAGVPLTAAQQLADHSTPTLTANIYTRWGPAEMADQVAKLPRLGSGGSGLGRGLQFRDRRIVPGRGQKNSTAPARNTKNPRIPLEIAGS